MSTKNKSYKVYEVSNGTETQFYKAEDLTAEEEYAIILNSQLEAGEEIIEVIEIHILGGYRLHV